MAFGSGTYLFTQRVGQIVGLLFPAAFANLGGTFLISGPGNAAPNGNVAFDNLNDRFLSVWRDQGDAQRNIQARIVNPDGTFATEPFVAVDEFPGSVRATFDDQNRRYLIVFNDFQSRRLRGRFISEDGSPVGQPFAISDDRVIAFETVYHAAKRAFVILANTQPPQPDGPLAIVAFAVRGDGRVGRDRVVLSTNGANPALALNPQAGECLAAWIEVQTESPERRVVARRLTFGDPACPRFPLCGAGLCGIGVCGGGFAPMMPLMVAGWVWMKRRQRAWKVRATL